MKTPIYDLVKSYSELAPTRLHMPGHKGTERLGCEKLDITEIPGADVLYEANGIINESENNASALFGTAHTFYSTEGSSLCIRAMLALAAFDSENVRNNKSRPLILSARNVHKSFIYACALMDIDVSWIMRSEISPLLGSTVSAQEVSDALSLLDTKPCAVYITSPDYSGAVSPIGEIAEVCHRNGIPLIVDNAHGAHLAFCEGQKHPIALGADMCCDSAHKTLPVLTGGAYLHVSRTSPRGYLENSRSRLALFASTSPSYLILQSLDLCNRYIAEELPKKLPKVIKRLDALKHRLTDCGYTVLESEPLKLTLSLNSEPPISKDALCAFLEERGIFAEYYDVDNAIFMISSETAESELEKTEQALIEFINQLPRSPYLQEAHSLPSKLPSDLRFHKPKQIMSIRGAIFAPHETISVKEALGRICASPTVSCPPAIPIASAGEMIDERAILLFRHYGIETVDTVSLDI